MLNHLVALFHAVSGAPNTELYMRSTPAQSEAVRDYEVHLGFGPDKPELVALAVAEFLIVAPFVLRMDINPIGVLTLWFDRAVGNDTLHSLHDACVRNHYTPDNF